MEKKPVNKKIIIAVAAAVVVIIAIILCLTMCGKNDEEPEDTAKTTDAATTAEAVTTTDTGAEKAEYYLALAKEGKIVIPTDATTTTVADAEDSYTITESENYVNFVHGKNYFTVINDGSTTYQHIVHGKFSDSDPADSWAKYEGLSEDNLSAFENKLATYRATLPMTQDDVANITEAKYIETVTEEGKVLDRFSVTFSKDGKTETVELWLNDEDKAVVKASFTLDAGTSSERTATVIYSGEKITPELPGKDTTVYSLNNNTFSADGLFITVFIKVIE